MLRNIKKFSTLARQQLGKYNIILLRHGQSQWNLENRFTGWVDVPLTQLGEIEAKKAGQLIKSAGLIPDIVFTSMLKRAIKTSWLVLEEIDLFWIHQEKSWRLNEKHYGKLSGLNKEETIKKYGKNMVHKWRRSYTTPPPFLIKTSEYWPGHDSRYADLDPKDIPVGESLQMTLKRVIPYWEGTIIPAIKSGKIPLIVAHHNSLRALIKYLDEISDEDIVQLDIPTGIPLIYHLDENFKPIPLKNKINKINNLNGYYLID